MRDLHEDSHGIHNGLKHGKHEENIAAQYEDQHENTQKEELKRFITRRF